MKPHTFKNSNPKGFDSNCLICEGKHRDAIHHHQVDIDKVHESRWDDGTSKSTDNDFNWRTPPAKPSPLTKLKAPQRESLNSKFNVAFSSNTPGVLHAVVPMERHEEHA